MSYFYTQGIHVTCLEPVFMLNTSVRDEVETSSAFKSIVESLKLVVVAISCNEPCVLVAAWDVGRVSCHKNNVLWVYQVQEMAVCASADATRSGKIARVLLLMALDSKLDVTGCITLYSSQQSDNSIL